MKKCTSISGRVASWAPPTAANAAVVAVVSVIVLVEVAVEAAKVIIATRMKNKQETK